MKCSNCDAEWTVPDAISKSITSCPFCGKSISSPVSTQLNTVEDVLREISARFGVDTFRNAKKTIGLFADLSPSMQGERLLLSYLFQADGNNKLLEARNKSEKEQQVCFLQVYKHMIERQFIADNPARSICMSFSTAIGLRVYAESANEKAVPTNSVSTQASSSMTTSVPTRQTKTPTSTSHSTSATIAPTNRKTVSTSTSAPQAKVGINSFQHYQIALESYYLNSGKVPLSEIQIRNFLSSNSLDRTWGITVADVQKDLAVIYSKYRPRNSSANNSVKIDTYAQYIKALEDYYILIGKTPLTENQIRHFISTYSLDTLSGLTVRTIQNDLKSIYAKYTTNVYQPKTTSTSTAALSFPKDVKIYTYPKYLAELEKAYLRNGKVMLSKTQIAAFLDAYSLNKNFGILVSEVEKDLSEIAKKYS